MIGPDLFTSILVLPEVRTFLAPDHFAGFGLLDILIFSAGLAGLVTLAFARSLRERLSLLAYHPGWAMLVLALLAIGLRVVLLPGSPIPTPSGSDDFGYILLADTLRHLRLANPPHILPQFFEQIFVLQRPTYSSMFNLGQGLVLALGWNLFGHPWAGVLLSIGTLSACCYWMLRAWVTPGWAFLGGLLTVMQFGPLSYWTNSYWGGAVSAIAGCFVFGALPRLAARLEKRSAVFLGMGLALQLLTRPYEFLLLLACVALAVPPIWRRYGGAILLVPSVLTSLIALSAGGLILLQNKSVTGSWTLTPYLLYRFQYGIPATFTFERNPLPHAALNQEQELDFKAESTIHGNQPETFLSYLKRFIFRIRFYRFFLLPPLYLALIAFLIRLRSYEHCWIWLSILFFALGSNFYPYFYPHYIAAVACLFVLISVLGVQYLNQLLPWSGSLLLGLCALQFLVSYSIHAFAGAPTRADLNRYESWDFINFGDPQGRRSVDKQLASFRGKLLVFVHYAPTHGFEEWVHNEADIDRSRIVRVHDLGPDENERLLHYYPGRTALLLKVDETPPKLIAYPSEASPFKDVP